MQKDFNDFGEDYSLFYLDIIETPVDNDLEFVYMNKFNTFDEDIGYNQGDIKYKGYKEITIKRLHGMPIVNSKKENEKNIGK